MLQILISALDEAKGRHVTHQTVRKQLQEGMCILDDYDEHHVVHHNTMDSVTDVQQVVQNGRIRIGVGCCLRLKLGSACILLIADNVFGDNPVISNASNTVSQMCNKVVEE